MYYVLKYNNNSSLLVDNNNNNNTVTFIFKYDVFYYEKNKYIQYCMIKHKGMKQSITHCCGVISPLKVCTPIIIVVC